MIKFLTVAALAALSWLLVVLAVLGLCLALTGDTAHASPAPVTVPWLAGQQPGTAGNGLGVLTSTDPLPDWDTIDRCQNEIRAGRAFVSYQPEDGPCAALPTIWWDHAVQVIDDEAGCTRTCEGEDYRCTPICEDN
jgi:hypothetical protein